MMRTRGYQMRRGLPTVVASAFITILFLLTAVTMMCPTGIPETRAGILGSYPVVVNVTVVDDVGRLIEGADVSVVGWPGVYNQTDASGFVQITDLFAGDLAPGTSYNFTASKVGYTPALRQAWLTANLTYNVTLILGGATVQGYVMTPAGQFVPGATVYANSTTTSFRVYSGTGSDGWFQIDGIPFGRYDMTATKGDFVSGFAYNVSITVGLPCRQNLTITPLGGSISGSVKSSSGSPLEGVDVSVVVGEETRSRPTNRTGVYMLPGLPEGNYTVTATLSGFYSNNVKNVPVTRGMDTLNINITLEPKPNRLYGVVKAGTLLLPGVNVSILGTAYYNLSNYEGSYQITNITAGTYNISASLSGYATNITEVTIPAGSDVLVLINLRQLPGAQLLVKVTATDTGSPLVGVRVSISLNGGDSLTQTTNIDGKFAFTGLTPGNYTVQLVKDGYRPLEVNDIAILAEENETLNLLMEPLREGDTGFIFGFDMAHSMMILALFLTIVILAMAVWLRIKTFQAPENAPAVYDEAPEEPAEAPASEGEPTEEAMQKLAAHSTRPSEGPEKKNGK
jgi:hypothetical protein